MDNCEKCYTHNIDELKKVTYQGMTFCSIDCFLNSEHVKGVELDCMVDLQSDYDELQKEFEESEDIAATLKALNETLCEKLEALLNKYDDKFKEGNEDLDEILLAITEIKEECED